LLEHLIGIQFTACAVDINQFMISYKAQHKRIRYETPLKRKNVFQLHTRKHSVSIPAEQTYSVF